jgi:hypothetical protein
MDRTRPLVRQMVLLAAAFLVTLPREADAQILWTDWLTATIANPGTASGTIPTLPTPVTVTYTGEVFATTQTTCGNSYFVPTTPFISATVPNAPPPCEIVSLQGGPNNSLNHTITFSQPILNPVMAILSLGQPGVTITYHFDSPFNILSFGPGFFGAPGTLSQLTPNVLTGVEGHGVIQFQGTFSSINWTVPTTETWHGFTVGVVGLAPPTIPTNPVPEPASVALMLVGLSAVAAAARMRKRR